ncbi:UDP-glycosyltransferase 74F2-like [Tasmannia lanceolata]|uniref:UDP-glycosyltransferase 74F2-like n=1 Tax=Tasmannia lanceolata TaxID=3420 RepID=UPI004064645E
MEEKRDRALHVLLVPYPAQGHINPLLQFAKRLASKGIKVTLANTIYLTKSMKAETGIVTVETISDGYDDGGFESSESNEAYHERLIEFGTRTLTELIEKKNSSNFPFSCVIYDAFLPWALEVAKRLNLPGGAFFTQLCAVNVILYHVYCGKLSVIPPENGTIYVPGVMEFEVSEVPSFVSAPGTYPAFRELVLNQFSNLEKADWVFVNTFDKLEGEVVHWMEARWPVKTIGPTVPSMYLDKKVEGDNAYGLNLWNPNTGTCMKWLDKRPVASVVYVSFGSFATLGTEQMEELAWGLRGSNKYFLWVVREAEENKLPDKFVEETREKGLVVTWCPQLEVLAHKAVGCFTTHCGWNSTLEALSLGVPMVAMPQWTDQPTNAKYVEDVWRVGVRAKVDEKGIVRREEMELSIKAVMEGENGEEFKRNASKWRELAIDAVDEGGSSDRNIAEFVAILNKEDR